MPLSQVGEVDYEDFPSSINDDDDDDDSNDNHHPVKHHNSSAGRHDQQPPPPTIEAPPTHPIASMQAAFEESILESTQPSGDGEDDDTADAFSSSMRIAPSSVSVSGDLSGARARRQHMLEQDDYSSIASSRLQKKAGAKYHAFWKLAAQISFGIHLLHDQLAKSDEEVVKIMQAHVDEIDAFLERTTEDFDLAITDISERINFLKLPLEHIDIFEVMLADKKFCTSIVEGNGKIETIVNRTARAMNESLLDIAKGIEATSELGKYLDTLSAQWSDENPEFLGIYTAMRGNTEGWYRCFRRLQLKGSSLGVLLVQLGSMLTEMSKRVGVSARRGPTAVRAGSSLERSHSGRSGRSTSSAPTSRFSAAAPQKPLPYTPSASQTTLQQPYSRQNSVSSSDRRYEQPRKHPRPPQSNGVRPSNGDVRIVEARKENVKPLHRDRDRDRDGQQHRRVATREKEHRRTSNMEPQQQSSRHDRSKNVSRRSSQRSDRSRALQNGNGRPPEANHHRSSHDASESKITLKKSSNSHGSSHSYSNSHNNSKGNSNSNGNNRHKHASIVADSPPSTIPDSGYWPGTTAGAGSGPNAKASAKASAKMPSSSTTTTKGRSSRKPLLKLGLFPSASNLSMTSMPSVVSRSRIDSTQSSAAGFPAGTKGVSGRSTPMTTSASSVLRKKPSFAALKRMFKRGQPAELKDARANFME